MPAAFRLALLVPVLVLAACGDEGAPTVEQTAAPPAPAAPAAAPSAETQPAPATSPAPEPSAAPAAAAAVGTRYVDHTKDEIEFSLKKSKAGLEALVEDYDQRGLDSGPLKEQIAGIDAKLDSL